MPDTAKCQGPFSLPGIGLPGIGLPGITYTTLSETAVPCGTGNGCSVLPLQLLKFDAVRINNSEVLLNWKTTNEYNNAGFDIERSLAAPNTFTKVNFTPAIISTSNKKEYDLLDDNNYSGMSYYRLKQMDFDGKYSYSNIVAVKGYDEVESFSVRPNPVLDYVIVDVFSKKAGVSSLNILSAEGKMVYRQPINLSKGNNRYKILLSFLPKGIYIIETSASSGQLFSAKLIKQ